jgi:hypothetical protein
MLPPKYQVPLTPRAMAPTLKWERSARAGGSQRQQCESQRVFVQSRCLFQRRDLLRRQQGGKCASARTGPGLTANSLQAGRKQLENVDAWRCLIKVNGSVVYGAVRALYVIHFSLCMQLMKSK